MKRLIVNADDYGLTPGVSEGIRRAYTEGIVRSTTVMMNQPSAARELETLLQDCPALGLGVHLTLTAGFPLLPAAQLPSLVRPDGRFWGQEHFFAHPADIAAEQALAEWRAQVQLFTQVTGRRPDHLDAHHHSAYASPALLEALLTLARELDCPIRAPANDAGLNHELLAASAVRHPDALCLDFYGEQATAEQMRRCLQHIADSNFEVWEIMAHPAVVDPLLRQVSSYTAAREQELAILTDPEITAFLSAQQISLTSFNCL